MLKYISAFIFIGLLFAVVGIGVNFYLEEINRYTEVLVYKKDKLIDRCSRRVLWNRQVVYGCENAKSYVGFPQIEYSPGKFQVIVR